MQGRSQFLNQNWRYPPNEQDTESLISSHQYHRSPAIQAVINPLESTSMAAATSDVLFQIWQVNVTAENLIYGSVVITVDGLLVITNLFILIIVFANESLQDVINYYLMSLAISDILMGLCVCPLAIYASFNNQWRFGGDNNPLCKSVAYLGVCLVCANVYIFVWIGVDRYAVVHKPVRYETEQTFTRCKCWILFTWCTATLLCCPTLFTNMSKYFDYTKVCLVDWSVMPAYSITLSLLVLVPTLICIFYSYLYIFRKWLSIDRQSQELRVVIENDSTIVMVFVTMIVFALSWLPWLGLRAYETAYNVEINFKALHFSLLWFGISGGCWKVIIFSVLNPEFRRCMARVCCLCRCGKPRHSDYNMINGINRRGERFL